MAAAAAAAMVERLEALACPALLPASLPAAPAEALTLLCHPSETRRALLEWICIRVHPPLAAQLESLPEDSRMRELAKLGAKLMLCGDDDLTLVEGSAPPEQQLQFFQDLLDAAPPLRDPQKTSSTKTTQFLLELLQSPEGGAALRPPEPPPLPLQPPGSPPRPRRPLPQLEVELGELRQSLEELQAKLSSLGVSPPPSPPNPGVPGGTLASLIAAFGVSELRDPLGASGEKQPQNHPCGPQTRNVGRGLQGLSQLLGSLAELGAAAGEVTVLGGVSQEIQPQIPPISLRFHPPRL